MLELHSELLLLAFFLSILLLKSVSQDLLSTRVQATSYCRVLLEVERLCILHRCSVIAHHLAEDVLDVGISLPKALFVFEILHCSDLLKQLILASLRSLSFCLTRDLWHCVLGHVLLHEVELLLRFDYRMDQLAVKLGRLLLLELSESDRSLSDVLALSCLRLLLKLIFFGLLAHRSNIMLFAVHAV